MTIMNKNSIPKLIYICGGALLLGALLLWLSFRIAPPAEPGYPSITPPPPPTWSLLPTRRPDPTPSPTFDPLAQPFKELQNALQSRDLEAAEEIWDGIYRIAPDYGPTIRERARIALAKGEFIAAEAYAWNAIQLIPEDAETWSLLGIILVRTGSTKAAEQALQIAQSLDPELAKDLFIDRWYAARRAGDGETMNTLAYMFSEANPDAPLAFYFRAAALLAIRDPESAFIQVFSLLKSDGNAPAVLWYTLGETYIASHAYSETITVMEVAGARFAQGDVTLYLASDDPIYDLNLALANAYINSAIPENCSKAEPILQRLTQQNPKLTSMMEQSILCQTPTPTWTPWLPSERMTPTPKP